MARAPGLYRVHGVLWQEKPQPWIICLSPLPELQCLTPCLAWVWQLVLMRPNSDVIRWSMKGGTSIPPCTSGTIFRSNETSSDGP